LIRPKRWFLEEEKISGTGTARGENLERQTAIQARQNPRAARAFTLTGDLEFEAWKPQTGTSRSGTNPLRIYNSKA
jgi:hypothetical protein